MKTKIVNGTFHFKRKRFIYWDGAIKSAKKISGKLRIIENNRNIYVVLPADSNTNKGFMIPIIENYDSLEEIK